MFWALGIPTKKIGSFGVFLSWHHAFHKNNCPQKSSQNGKKKL
jgi:hypothetical protein